jgi:hypothetical protein
MDEFTRAYIETALWASMDESDESGRVPLDRNYGPDDIAPETLAVMQADCARFQVENAADLAVGPLRYGPDYGPEGHMGHDFFLTRCGHGAGYWDGDYPEGVGQRLTEAAHKFGEFNLYIGDDGMIYGAKG